jgi:hypothetical protein
MIWHEQIDDYIAFPFSSRLDQRLRRRRFVNVFQEYSSSISGARCEGYADASSVQLERQPVLLFCMCQHSVPANGYDIKMVTVYLISKQIRLAFGWCIET